MHVGAGLFFCRDDKMWMGNVRVSTTGCARQETLVRI